MATPSSAHGASATPLLGENLPRAVERVAGRDARILATAIAAAIVLAVSMGGCGPSARTFAEARQPYREGATFAVVGDLQHTAPILEAVRESNDAERILVIREIARSHPDLLLITGDCVFDGGSTSQWARFDGDMTPVRDAGIPVATALGNHEYWLGDHAAAHVFPRFPLAGPHRWYWLAFGPLRIVVLDSNSFWLGARWSEQRRWFRATLAAFDADANVRGIVVAFHHPPWTNSTVTGDGRDIQDDIVPDFESSPKTMAMLNGHVHSYERYSRGARMYVVSGGGGGPRARLSTGAARRHTDDHFSGGDLRPFHFTTYAVDGRGLHASVHGLEKGGSEFRPIDGFYLPWPPAE